MSLAWIAPLILLSAVSMAADDHPELTDRYRARIEQTLQDVKTLEPSCPTCQISTTAGETTASPSPACRKTYRSFYKIKDRLNQETQSDQDIDIRLAFGYMDFGNAVDDYYAASAFADEMQGPCYAGRFACGFEQDPDDANHFVKVIRLLGPDGKPRIRRMHLRIHFSSATSDEKTNRGSGHEEQEAQTEETRTFFLDGLSHADMVMYVGHARDGGGPDFGPPVVNPKTRHTDFPWYHQHPDNLKAVTEALAATTTPPKILGIFACYSEGHFLDPLRKAAPKTGLVLSGKSEFESITGQAAATLDSVLGLRCEADFTRSVDTIKNIYDYDISPVRIDGVFGGPAGR